MVRPRISRNYNLRYTHQEAHAAFALVPPTAATRRIRPPQPTSSAACPPPPPQQQLQSESEDATKLAVFFDSLSSRSSEAGLRELIAGLMTVDDFVVETQKILNTPLGQKLSAFLKKTIPNLRHMLATTHTAAFLPNFHLCLPVERDGRPMLNDTKEKPARLFCMRTLDYISVEQFLRLQQERLDDVKARSTPQKTGTINAAKTRLQLKSFSEPQLPTNATQHPTYAYECNTVQPQPNIDTELAPAHPKKRKIAQLINSSLQNVSTEPCQSATVVIKEVAPVATIPASMPVLSNHWNYHLMAAKIERLLPGCGRPDDKILDRISNFAENKLVHLIKRLSQLQKNRVKRSHAGYRAINAPIRNLRFVEKQAYRDREDQELADETVDCDKEIQRDESTRIANEAALNALRRPQVAAAPSCMKTLQLSKPQNSQAHRITCADLRTVMAIDDISCNPKLKFCLYYGLKGISD